MRELHGVVHSDRICSQDLLKRHLLLFDRLSFVAFNKVIYGFTRDIQHDLDFLASKGIVERRENSAGAFHVKHLPISPSMRAIVIEDLTVNYFVNALSTEEEDVVGVYQLFPPTLFDRKGVGDQPSSLATVFSVAFNALPVPDESSALEDVLNVRSEVHFRQWRFRRFLKDLATKNQTESEIRDHID